MISTDAIKLADEYAARYTRHLPVIGMFREALIGSASGQTHIWRVDALDSHLESFTVKFGLLNFRFVLSLDVEYGDFGGLLEVWFMNSSLGSTWEVLREVTFNAKGKTPLRTTGEDELFISDMSGAREFFQGIVALALKDE